MSKPIDKQELIERITTMLRKPDEPFLGYSMIHMPTVEAIATAWIEDREKAQDEAHYKGAHLALEKVAAHDPRFGEPSDELTTYVMTRIDADSFWWIANEVRHALTKTKEDK